MWLELATVSTLVFLEGVTGEVCPFTVSVLDVPGVQCVTAVPCSGTYYASGLSQGVGACPTGSSCALLPLTPIMGCATTGRTDLVYVKADGTLTKDGKLVTLLGAPLSTSDPTTVSTSNSTNSIRSTYNATNSSSSKSRRKNTTGSNANFGSTNKNSDDNAAEDDASKKALSTSSRNVTSSKDKTLNSLSYQSDSGSHTVSPGNSSANQQAEFNPGSILSDGSTISKSSSSGGLGFGSIIAIVVGCLAVVAIAAGARLLKKGKEAELATPGAAGGLEAYNNVDGGGGGGITPKESVLLL